MNILFVTDLYPLEGNHKGVPKTIENFALALKDLGHSVFVLRADLVFNTLLRGRKIYPQGEYLHNGIKIINKNFLLPNYHGLDFLKKENFDVIISHMPSGTLCATKIKEKFKKPHITILHSSDIEVIEKYKIHFSSALKKALNRADSVGARSYWIKEKFKNKEAFLLPSGIKKEDVISKDKAIEKFKNTRPLKIACVSSFIKRKNVRVLIEAVKNIKDIDIELKIFGTGRGEKKLKKQASGAKIYFMGQVEKNEVLKNLRDSHVFILPSIKETFGLSYLEALASGCITLCSKSSGMDGWIKDSCNGFIIEPNAKSIEDTIRKIYSLNHNALAQISQNGINLALELEYYKCAQIYLENIKKIL